MNGNGRTALVAPDLEVDDTHGASPSSAVGRDRPCLRVGSRGDAVLELQRLLRSTDCGVRSTGYFGSLTRVAVVGFQRSRGLRVDGVCGRRTWSALESLT